MDINRINEIFRIHSIVAKSVWPGFENAKFSFILVGQSHQWAFNVDPMPSYYKITAVPAALNKDITSLGVSTTFYNELGEKKSEAPEILYNSYSKEQTGLHFKQSIYFVKTLDEYHRIKDKQDAEEWVHISFHELFHTFQDRYVDYTNEFEKAIQVPFKKKSQTI